MEMHGIVLAAGTSTTGWVIGYTIGIVVVLVVVALVVRSCCSPGRSATRHPRSTTR